MGGATEAAIWSNFIQVQLPLPSKWVSIPYGKPLAGQLYRTGFQENYGLAVMELQKVISVMIY